jgi:hypothetical protein
MSTQFDWRPVVIFRGETLEDLFDAMEDVLKWLRDRGVSPSSFTLDDFRLMATQTPKGPATALCLRTPSPFHEKLPGIFSGTALGRLFTVGYEEGILAHAEMISLEGSSKAMWSGGGGDLVDSRGEPASWSHVGELGDGVRGAVFGITNTEVVKVRARRASGDMEDLLLHRIPSRFPVRCAATLLDEATTEVRFLDVNGNLLYASVV